MKRISATSIFIFVLFSSIIVLNTAGCESNFKIDEPIGSQTYTLINQDSVKVEFPTAFKNKILVMGFIYTNCPDICPLTTHNMEKVQNEVKKLGLKNVEFAALSFDPDRDKPYVLKKYGEIRNIDFQNFQFLTGNKKDIKNIIKDFEVYAIPGDTTVTEGDTLYFYTHTDRITLIDQNLHQRAKYQGSKVDPQDIVNDIKELE